MDDAGLSTATRTWCTAAIASRNSRSACAAFLRGHRARGGGIQATVNATRAPTRHRWSPARVRARRLMSEGVTTIEVKSGYGLDSRPSGACSRWRAALERELPVSVKTTYLGLHALPKEYRDARHEFVHLASGRGSRRSPPRAWWTRSMRFARRSPFRSRRPNNSCARRRTWGLPAHVHAGQLSDMGAAELAAQYGALSADHLEYLSEDGVRRSAAAGTVAVLLPGAYFMLRQTTPPPVALLREAGVPMAVATDCNPGTSPCTSLLLALNMGCALFGLTPEESLSGATRKPPGRWACTEELGTLEVGKRADFALWRIERPAELCYNLGAWRRRLSARPARDALSRPRRGPRAKSPFNEPVSISSWRPLRRTRGRARRVSQPGTTRC